MNIDPDKDHGRVVWARLKRNSPPWAGLILSGKKLGLSDDEKNKKTWIFWLSCNSFSNVEKKFVYNFSSCYDVYSKNMAGNRKKGLFEAIEILAIQLRLIIPEDVLRTDNMILWARKNLINITENLIGKQLRHAGYCIPNEILKQIQVLISKNKAKELQTNTNNVVKNSVSGHQTGIKKNHNTKKSSVRQCCIACKNPLTGKKYDHPLFIGRMCESCHVNMKRYIMTICDDNYNNVCCICCVKEDYMVVLCELCIRIYCEKCISHISGESAYSGIIDTKLWKCYACTSIHSFPSWLDKRSTEEQLYNIFSLFTSKKQLVPKKYSIPEISILILNDRQNLVPRMMSSLDYPYVLENASTNVFMADYNMVPPINYNLLIQYADYDNKNLSTIQQFYDFVFVKNNIENAYSMNGDVLFWAFECSSAISFNTREIISGLCKVQPILVSMGVVDVRQRGRFIWTNIFLSENKIRGLQRNNIFVQKIDDSELQEIDTPWCYESISLIISSFIKHHIE